MKLDGVAQCNQKHTEWVAIIRTHRLTHTHPSSVNQSCPSWLMIAEITSILLSQTQLQSLMLSFITLNPERLQKNETNDAKSIYSVCGAHEWINQIASGEKVFQSFLSKTTRVALLPATLTCILDAFLYSNIWYMMLDPLSLGFGLLNK